MNILLGVGVVPAVVLSVTCLEEMGIETQCRLTLFQPGSDFRNCNAGRFVVSIFKTARHGKRVLGDSKSNPCNSGCDYIGTLLQSACDHEHQV